MKKLLCLVTMFIISSCAFLQSVLILELDSSHLTCISNPEIVDGNLITTGVLQSELGVARRGSGILIKLDKLTYVKYIEIHAASKMFDVLIYVATDEPKGQSEIAFTAIRGYPGSMIGRGQVGRYQIGKEVLYLKLLTDWVKEGQRGVTIKKSLALNRSRVIPMKGPSVSEVKFYTVSVP